MTFAPHDRAFDATKIERLNAKLIDFNAIPPDSQVAKAFGVTHPFSVLSRPDNYRGFRSTEPTLSELTVYLEKFVGKQPLDGNAKIVHSR
jgi:hypothetical protein